METSREENAAAVQEHGPEHWFSNWERQCLSETDQGQPTGDELDQNIQHLWQKFQKTAAAVTHLYRDRACRQQGASTWLPFQNAAIAVTNLYKESIDIHQQSFELGIRLGQQRRNKDVLAWVKKRRNTIWREDLISFLCGKALPPRGSIASPRFPPKWQPSSVSISPMENDLQPFCEAINGLSSTVNDISVCSGTPGSSTQVSSTSSNPGHCRNDHHDVDLNTFIAEDMALHMENNGRGGRKRPTIQCNDVLMRSPSHKRNRMI